MVLLTAVPVSATGFDGDRGDGGDRAAGAGGNGQRVREPAVGGAPASPAWTAAASHRRVVAAEQVVDIRAGGQAQARRQRKSQEQAPFEPVLCWNSPHYALRCPASDLPGPRASLFHRVWRQNPTPSVPQMAGGPSLPVLTSGAEATRDQMPLGAEIPCFHRDLGGFGRDAGRRTIAAGLAGLFLPLGGLPNRFAPSKRARSSAG